MPGSELTEHRPRSDPHEDREAQQPPGRARGHALPEDEDLLLSDQGELALSPASTLDGRRLTLADARTSAGGPAPVSGTDPLALRLTKLALHAPPGAHPRFDDVAQAVLFESADKHRRMTEFLDRKGRA